MLFRSFAIRTGYIALGYHAPFAPFDAALLDIVDRGDSAPRDTPNSELGLEAPSVFATSGADFDWAQSIAPESALQYTLCSDHSMGDK